MRGDVQVKLKEGQQQLTAANTELQQLHRQINTITQQEKAAIGAKSRAAHRVQQLQVWLFQIGGVDGCLDAEESLAGGQFNLEFLAMLCHARARYSRS